MVGGSTTQIQQQQESPAVSCDQTGRVNQEWGTLWRLYGSKRQNESCVCARVFVCVREGGRFEEEKEGLTQMPYWVRRPGLTCTAQNLSQILVSWPWYCENGRAGHTPLVCPVVAWVTERCPPSLTPQYLQLFGAWHNPLTSCGAPEKEPSASPGKQTWVSQPWDCEGI